MAEQLRAGVRELDLPERRQQMRGVVELQLVALAKRRPLAVPGHHDRAQGVETVEPEGRVQLDAEAGGRGIRIAGVDRLDVRAAETVVGGAGRHAVDIDLHPVDPEIVERPAVQRHDAGGDVAATDETAERTERRCGRGGYRDQEEACEGQQQKIARHRALLTAPGARPMGLADVVHVTRSVRPHFTQVKRRQQLNLSHAPPPESAARRHRSRLRGARPAAPR